MHRRSFIQAGAAASLIGALPRFARAQQLPFDPQAGGLAHVRDHQPDRDPEARGRIARLGAGAVGAERLPEGDRQYLVGQRLDAARARRQVRRRDGDVGVERLRKGAGARGGEHVFHHQPRHRLRQAQSGDQDRPRHGQVRHRADRAHSHRRHRAQDRATRSRAARAPTSTRRAPSTSGSSTTRFRDPKTRGCGIGDIKAMLETGDSAASAPT